jgi:hypothetical protein
MSDDRKNAGVAFWATVVVVTVLAAYPVSFGPACWIASCKSAYTVPDFYMPVGRLVRNLPDTIKLPAVYYVKLWISKDAWSVKIPVGRGKYLVILRD